MSARVPGTTIGCVEVARWESGSQAPPPSSSARLPGNGGGIAKYQSFGILSTRRNYKNKNALRDVLRCGIINKDKGRFHGAVCSAAKRL
jgi:hypothetical protein